MAVLVGSAGMRGRPEFRLAWNNVDLDAGELVWPSQRHAAPFGAGCVRQSSRLTLLSFERSPFSGVLLVGERSTCTLKTP